MKEDLLRFEAYLLDFDGTLVDYHVNEKKALESLLASYSVPRELWNSALRTYHEINIRCWKAFRAGKLSAEEVRNIRFEELSQHIPQLSDPRGASELYLSFFVEHVTPLKGCFELLGLLRDKGKKTFVVTNGFHKVQEERLKRTGILNYVDGFVTSELIGAPKPDPKMLEHALRSMDVRDRSQAILIGDSLESDIGAARNLGIPSVLIGDVPASDAITPTLTFPSTWSLYQAMASNIE